MKAAEEVELLLSRHAATHPAGERRDRCLVAVAQQTHLEVEEIPEYLRLQGVLP